MKKGYSKKSKPAPKPSTAPKFKDCQRCGLHPGKVMVNGVLVPCPVCGGKGKVRNK